MDQTHTPSLSFLWLNYVATGRKTERVQLQTQKEEGDMGSCEHPSVGELCMESSWGSRREWPLWE